jgi:hypothetical protein
MIPIVSLLPSLLCYVLTTRLYLTSRQVTGVWMVLFGASSIQVHDSCERDHNDQANIWQVYPNANICQINIFGNGVTV